MFVDIRRRGHEQEAKNECWKVKEDEYGDIRISQISEMPVKPTGDPVSILIRLQSKICLSYNS